MSEPTPSDAVRAMRRQVRRVRWRRNTYELQRTLYLLIATAATAATALVLLALTTGPAPFTVGAGGVAAASLLAAAATLLATRRRWLRASRAPLWIDAEAKLQGRLATLMELPSDRRARFLPLLVEENRRRLASWEPEALLPNPFPPAALGAATAAAASLMLALVLGPRLQPPLFPEPGRRARIARMVPEARRFHVGRDEPPSPASGSADDVHVTRAGALQETIRRRLWGPEWQAAAEALASAAERPGNELGSASLPAAAGELERSWEIARRPASGAARASGERGEGAHSGERAGAEAFRGEASRAAAAEPARGLPAAGAGTATDPDLFGPATDTSGGGGVFELPLGARVRGLGAAPAPPTGEPPPADSDVRPDLAPRQRREAPVLKANVPAAYEPIVRRMFGHGS